MSYFINRTNQRAECELRCDRTGSPLEWLSWTSHGHISAPDLSPWVVPKHSEVCRHVLDDLNCHHICMHASTSDCRKLILSWACEVLHHPLYHCSGYWQQHSLKEECPMGPVLPEDWTMPVKEALLYEMSVDWMQNLEQIIKHNLIQWGISSI